jgi:anti-sigma28 factor (negative regulator of flagellin synthesis)
MKVQDSNSTSLSRLCRTETVAPGGTPRSPSAKPPPHDHVQISTLSSALAALEMQAGERAAKVVQLSDTVASGRYHVDAHVLSDRLIQEHMRAAA